MAFVLSLSSQINRFFENVIYLNNMCVSVIDLTSMGTMNYKIVFCKMNS
jgi:hypothetical protein